MRLEQGQPVTRVEHGGRSEDILGPMRGTLGGVLGRDGEPVKAARSVARTEGAEGDRS